MLSDFLESDEALELAFNSLNLQDNEYGYTSADARWGVFGSLPKKPIAISDTARHYRSVIEKTVSTSAPFRPSRHRKELEGVPEVLQYGYDRRAVSIASVTLPNSAISALKGERNFEDTTLTSYVFPAFLRDSVVPCDTLDSRGRVRLPSRLIFSKKEATINLEGLLEATPLVIARHFSERLVPLMSSKTTLVEFCSGFGANTVEFGLRAEFVHTFELDPYRASLCEKNVQVYNLQNKVRVHNKDAIEFGFSSAARELALECSALNRPITTIFVSPPWGGAGHKAANWFSLVDVEAPNVVRMLEAAWTILKHAYDAARETEGGVSMGSQGFRLCVYLPRHIPVEELAAIGGILSVISPVAGIEMERILMRGPYQLKLHPVFSHKASLITFTMKEQQKTAGGLRNDALQNHGIDNGLKSILLRSFSAPKTEQEKLALVDLRSGATIRANERSRLAEVRSEVLRANPCDRVIEGPVASHPPDCVQFYFDQSLIDCVARRLPSVSKPRLSTKVEIEKILSVFNSNNGFFSRLPNDVELQEMKRIAQECHEAKRKNHEQSSDQVEIMQKHAHIPAVSLSTVDVEEGEVEQGEEEELKNPVSPESHSALSVCEEWYVSSDTFKAILKLFHFGFSFSVCEWLRELPNQKVATIRKIYEEIDEHQFMQLLTKAESVEFAGGMARLTGAADNSSKRTRGGVFFNLFKEQHRQIYNAIENIKRVIKRSREQPNAHPQPTSSKRPNPNSNSREQFYQNTYKKSRNMQPQLPRLLPEPREPLPLGGFYRDSNGKRIQQEGTVHNPSKYEFPE